ncbi:MAG: AAA family ATPase, partial [Clostridia bacterium]|nr:AAA family ATPase [Clostridia bacterium]
MQRFLMKQLKEWKENPNRKPLILLGARQVGKTWLMREFGRESFESSAYISFYNNSAASALFEQDCDTARIIKGLCALTHTDIHPEKTLIILDEVQNAPRALESLKYFCEDAPEYAVIAAGSLLGVAIHQGVSFPVGKVDELSLYPMTFREFLLALGEDGLANALQDY